MNAHLNIHDDIYESEVKRSTHIFIILIQLINWKITGDDCVSIQTGCSNVHIHHINCGPGHGIRYIY